MRVIRRRPDPMDAERIRWRLRLIATPVRMSVQDATSIETAWFVGWLKVWPLPDALDPNGYGNYARPLYEALWGATQ